MYTLFISYSYHTQHMNVCTIPRNHENKIQLHFYLFYLMKKDKTLKYAKLQNLKMR